MSGPGEIVPSWTSVGEPVTSNSYQRAWALLSVRRPTVWSATRMPSRHSALRIRVSLVSMKPPGCWADGGIGVGVDADDRVGVARRVAQQVVGRDHAHLTSRCRSRSPRRSTSACRGWRRASTRRPS